MLITKRGLTRVAVSIVAMILFIALVWYLFFSLSSYTVSDTEFKQQYSHQKVKQLNWHQEQVTPRRYQFEYHSFDGSVVVGQIAYPKPLAELTQPIPVMIGVHGLARSQVRWFQDSFKGRETLEATDDITQMALEKGYAVIAIDARLHGKRKQLNYASINTLRDLYFWGKREPYENMIRETVLDHRILLDWLTAQPQFDVQNINIAGYSMGAQIALLLAGVDERINNIAAMVPPNITNKTAIVDPKKVTQYITDNKVVLITANQDEYATMQENDVLFESIATADKQHIRFDSNHFLPSHYVQTLNNWF